MAGKKASTMFFCQECGHESSKWLGQCPGCRAWNSFVEETVVSANPSVTRTVRDAKPVALNQVQTDREERVRTTIEELEFAFIQLEKKYPELVKMVDIVGAEIQCMPIKKMLEKIGYYTYRQLVRMSKLTPSENTEIINQNVYFATLKDSKIIRELLLQNFDARCEQIPYQEELDEYVTEPVAA